MGRAVAVAMAAAACLMVYPALPLNADGAANPPQRSVPCREEIDTTRFPYPPYKLVLGAVSVPRHVLQVNGTGSVLPHQWRYFAKQGLVTESGKSVTIAVPNAWRTRLAISWGNNVHRVFHTIRIRACKGPANQGHAFAGGFYLRDPSACAPLVFVVGNRRQKVWFRLGQSCP